MIYDVCPHYAVSQKLESLNWAEITIHKANKKAISNGSVPGFDLAWKFISSSYKLNGGFSLRPIGWKLSHELSHSIAIAYISHRCNDLVLAVDKNEDVISLEILF